MNITLFDVNGDTTGSITIEISKQSLMTKIVKYPLNSLIGGCCWILTSSCTEIIIISMVFVRQC
ncbi:hypothetical protein DERP_012517 [Dermatophagoides pteronyssinus]|uniref:Uncharacterized protein n=1 Tax=Dermatophagoides pteronyssinus TaxID=6956 RepID=A0ABQ8IXL0_DERPT|nr:hypothetical protein DERP_012517 [Dermatophagoides pteronyssinus]